MATLVDRVARKLLSRLGLHSGYVETAVARHHYYDTGGTGDVIVCLPGLSDSASSWAAVVLALRRRGYRVLVVEGAGHGLSEQALGAYTLDAHLAAITEALDAILDRPAVLVGNSLGGTTALHYALQRAHRVRRLFLTSPGGGLHDEDALARIRRTFTVQSMRDAHVFLGLVLHRPTVAHRLLARVVRANCSSRAVAELVASLHVEQSIDHMHTIDVPIRLVWGRSERMLPQESLAWFRRELPTQAVVDELDGFGHCPHLDDPFRLARMIDSFVRE